MERLTTLALAFALASSPALAAGEPGAKAQRKAKAPKAADRGGAIVLCTAAAEDEDPAKAGKAAAEALAEALGKARPHVIVMAECYEGKDVKAKALAGVASVFPKRLIVGAANYGSFTQAGTLEADSVSLMAIAGDGITVQTALAPKMGAAGLSLETDKDSLADKLGAGAAALAKKLPKTDDARMAIVFVDAHSPKNALFIAGLHAAYGKDFPIVGGSVCKNAGQSWLYYGGKMYTDAAVGLMLSGDFKVALAGRQAKSNDAVIATAKEGSAAVSKAMTGKPIGLLAFNCAGRLGKLDDPVDELNAIKASVGAGIPIYGNYFAGEFGPADTAEKSDTLCSGCGWHVMFALLGR